MTNFEFFWKLIIREETLAKYSTGAFCGCHHVFTQFSDWLVDWVYLVHIVNAVCREPFVMFLSCMSVWMCEIFYYSFSQLITGCQPINQSHQWQKKWASSRFSFWQENGVAFLKQVEGVQFSHQKASSLGKKHPSIFPFSLIQIKQDIIHC